MRFLLANVLLFLLPPTRFFRFKRWTLNRLGVKVGEGSCVCGHVQFFGAGTVSIGKDCWIGINARFYTALTGNIYVHDRCDIAPETSFVTGSHDMGPRHRRAGAGWSKDIEVGAGSWIGTGSTILGGAVIGQGSVVGAKALVQGREWTRDSLLLGVPARAARQLGP